MARPKVKLDRAGVRTVLRSREVAREVHRTAEQIANEVRSSATVQRHDAEVVVDDYTTDRAASSVTIRHAGGLAMQAKHGVLTKARP